MAKTLPEKIERLSKVCLLAGGLMTAILLCFACFMPEKYADGVKHEKDAYFYSAGGGYEGAKTLHKKLEHGHDKGAKKTSGIRPEDGTVFTANEADAEPEAAEEDKAEDEEKGQAGAKADGPNDAAADDAFVVKKRRNVISRPFQEAWLIGWLFILAPTLGSFALLCITHLVTGGWAFVIRRILEAAMKTCIPVLFLFIPVLVPVILHQAFKDSDTLRQVTNYDLWLNVNTEDSHSIIATKVQYLDYGFFMVRLAVYFVCFAFFTHIFYRWSKKQDETGDLKWRKKMKAWAGPALLTYVLLFSFFAFDWMMSMEPEWFSSIYGVIWLIGQGVSTFAFCLIMVCWLAQASPIKENLPADRLHNIGNLQFAFVIIWTYVNVAQFIIIWSANLPEETPWYLNRGYGMFQGLTIFLFLFQFVVPFLILLSRHTKRHTKTIAIIAAWILFMRVIDIIWLIHPSVHGFEAAKMMGWAVPEYSAYHVLLALFAVVALGTLWFGLFLRNLKKLPLLPTRDPVFSPYYDYHEDLPQGAAQ